MRRRPVAEGNQLAYGFDVASQNTDHKGHRQLKGVMPVNRVSVSEGRAPKGGGFVRR
jgi:hypothetical protein